MSFVDPSNDIAARLRAARIGQGLALEALARELRNPVAVLETIERGDWPRLGAPVFARHLVGHYASRLGVAVDLDAVARTIEAPQLRSHVATSRMGRFADFSARHVAYVAGTLLVVPAVYTLLSLSVSRPVEVRALDPVASMPAPAIVVAPVTIPDPQGAPATPAAASLAAIEPAAPPAAAPASPPAAAPETAPPAAARAALSVSASLAGPLGASGRELELRFRGQSWVEVVGRDGRTLHQVLAAPGESLRFAAADVGRVTVGNVEATDVLLDGSTVNLDAVRAANVARFALSSDGSIEAVAR